MHDPMTVAHEIRRPWPDKKSKLDPNWKYYPSLVTIWHVDPETDGTDDSCDWFYSDFTKEERAAALALITNEFDNLNLYFRDMDPRDKEWVMLAQWRMARQFYKPRPWYKHPRWHIHHWKLQWHFGQALKRYLFSRCSRCGKRFPWNYAPMSDSWNGTGPRWFRGERGVYHHECGSSANRHPASVGVERCD